MEKKALFKILLHQSSGLKKDELLLTLSWLFPVSFLMPFAFFKGIKKNKVSFTLEKILIKIFYIYIALLHWENMNFISHDL